MTDKITVSSPSYEAWLRSREQYAIGTNCGWCGRGLPGGAPPLSDRIAALEAELQWFHNILAVIHGDGGHYRAAHGTLKAADDATAIYYGLRAELDAERERREAAEWVLKEIRIRLHAAGRRPEECWEMSEIDGHFAHFARYEKG